MFLLLPVVVIVLVVVVMIVFVTLTIAVVIVVVVISVGNAVVDIVHVTTVSGIAMTVDVCFLFHYYYTLQGSADQLTDEQTINREIMNKQQQQSLTAATAIPC